MAENQIPKRPLIRNSRFYWILIVLAGLLLYWWIFYVFPKRDYEVLKSGNYFWLDHIEDSLCQKVALLGCNPKQVEAPNVLMATIDSGANWHLLPVKGKTKAIFTQMDGRWKGDTLQVFYFNASKGVRIDYVWRDEWWLGYFDARFEVISTENTPIPKANEGSLLPWFLDSPTQKTNRKKSDSQNQEDLNQRKKSGTKVKGDFDPAIKLKTDQKELINSKSLPKIPFNILQKKNKDIEPNKKDIEPTKIPIAEPQKTQEDKNIAPPKRQEIIEKKEDSIKKAPKKSNKTGIQKPTKKNNDSVQQDIEKIPSGVFDVDYNFENDSLLVATSDGRMGWMINTENGKDEFTGLETLPYLMKNPQRILTSTIDYSDKKPKYIVRLAALETEIDTLQINKNHPLIKNKTVIIGGLRTTGVWASLSTNYKEKNPQALSKRKSFRLKKGILDRLVKYINTTSKTYFYSFFGSDIDLILPQSVGLVKNWRGRKINTFFELGNGQIHIAYDSAGISRIRKITNFEAAAGPTQIGERKWLKSFDSIIYNPKLKSEVLNLRLFWFFISFVIVFLLFWLWRTLNSSLKNQDLGISNPLILTGDRPSTEDKLNLYPAELDTVAQIIVDKRNEGPITFVIDAPWGRGKSSFMLTLKERLDTGEMLSVPPMNKPKYQQSQIDRIWNFIQTNFEKGRSFLKNLVIKIGEMVKKRKKSNGESLSE